MRVIFIGLAGAVKTASPRCRSPQSAGNSRLLGLRLDCRVLAFFAARRVVVVRPTTTGKIHVLQHKVPVVDLKRRRVEVKVHHLLVLRDLNLHRRLRLGLHQDVVAQAQTNKGSS